MVALESMVVNLARSIVKVAAAAWLADRRTAQERRQELSALLTPKLRRGAPEQRFIDDAAAELAAVGRHEFRGLDDGDRVAALLAVGAAFERANLDDRALFAVDVDAGKLARRLRAGPAASVAGLGEVGSAYYDAVLSRCCHVYVRAVEQVPAFLGRTLAEMLNRLSELPEQVARHVVDAVQAAQAAAADPRAQADAAVADRVRRLVDERAAVLAGRDPAAAVIDAHVVAGAARPLVIRAPAGFGKTALLAAWTRREHAADVTVAGHFFAADRDLTSVDDAYRQLLRQLSTAAPVEAEQLPGAVQQALTAWPGRAEGRLVVVLDALDEAAEIPASPPFPVPLPERVSVILSTRAGDDTDWLVPRLDAWTAGGPALELAPLDRDGLSAWLRLAGDGRLADRLTEDDLGALAAVTAGLPLFMRFVIDDLLTTTAAGGDPRNVIQALTAGGVQAPTAGAAEAPARGGVPAGFRRYLREEFVRLARGQVPATVQAMFALVAVAPGPLPLALMQDGAGLSAFDLAGLPWSVVRWFTVRVSGGEVVYAAAHPLLAREFRELLGRQASAAEQFLLRHCARWREDSTGWALRWYPDLLTRIGDGAQIYALARDDDFRYAQMAAHPEQPDLALAAGRAAIHHAAAHREVPAVGEFLLRHARDTEATMAERTPLEALRAGSPEEAIRRAALFDPERAPVWTLLLIGELADTGRERQAQELLAGLRTADLPPALGGWLARAAMVCAAPLGALAPERAGAMCHHLVLTADDGIEAEAMAGLTRLAEHFADQGRPEVALAVAPPRRPRQDAVRIRIAAAVAERDGVEPALAWVESVRGDRTGARAYAAIAGGRVKAGDDAGAALLFERARRAADAAADRREWALADLAVEQAKAGWSAAAAATIAEIADPFARSHALVVLVTEQVGRGDDPARAIDELRQLAADDRDRVIGLRLGAAYFRAGRLDLAAAVFERVLTADPGKNRRREVALARIAAGDIEGGYATLGADAREAGEELVLATAEQSGVPAALAELRELAAGGYEPHSALVGLAERAAGRDDGHTARTLLAQALGARQSRPVWLGSAAAEALHDIAATLAGDGRADDARTVAELISQPRWADWALPAIAAALADRDRLGEAWDLVDVAAGEWAKASVVAAVAASLEAAGRHAEAIAAVDRIDPGRRRVVNDALVRMGRVAAEQGRYADAADCRSRLTAGSLSVDPERDTITSAVAVAQGRAGDLPAALATVDQLRLEVPVATCLAELAGSIADPASLGERVKSLRPTLRLAPLVAMAAAARRAGRTAEADTTLRAALASFTEPLRLAGLADGHSAASYLLEGLPAVAATLARDLDRRGWDEEARQVRHAIEAAPVLRKHGLRELFLAYARDGVVDVAQWALAAMGDDYQHGEALRLLMSGPQPPPYGASLARVALRLRRRTWLSALALGLATAGDWEHLALLLRPAADSLDTACAMTANLAVCEPAAGLPLARLIASMAGKDILT